MYKALYDFSSKDPSALTFNAKDRFSVLDSTSDEHWWLVQNGTGLLGYVPGNYLVKDKTVGYKDVLQFIDRAISAIQGRFTTQGGRYTSEQKSNLIKLEKHRENVAREQSGSDDKKIELQRVPSETKRQAPQPPPTGQQIEISKYVGDESRKIRAPIPPWAENKTSDQPQLDTDPRIPAFKTPPTQGLQNDVKSTNLPNDIKSTSLPNEVKFRPANRQVAFAQTHKPRSRTSSECSTKSIPDNIYADLVDSVRNKTNISFDISRNAVSIVLLELRTKVPNITDIIDSILRSGKQGQSDVLDDSNLGEDGIRLQKHFNELAACKDDSQQRSWFLHEDETTICGNLQGLLDILDNANPEICRHVVSRDNYEAVHNLVLYYQMEVRVSIRLLLLQVFGVLCGLDVKIVSELLNSVLPLELARDIQSDVQDIQKFVYSSVVLTMIFSTGEALPVAHYVHMNGEFISFLLHLAENPPPEDTDDQLPDLIIQIVLAFNLHFELPSDNIVMKVLASLAATHFLEKLMLLINRERDPVRILPHDNNGVNSVLKFLSDMYSNPSTGNLLYTNDVKVLIDIILRHVRDLCPGDRMRTEYLSLFHLLLKNSSYGDHTHRKELFRECFHRLLQEEDVGPDSSMDKLIVGQIRKEFPHWFV